MSISLYNPLTLVENPTRMEHTITTHVRTRGSKRLSARSRKGYTMSEIIIVIVILGVLAAIAIPVYNNVRESSTDNVKIKNADMLNSMMTSIHNGGVDTTAWATAADAIGQLTSATGVTVPSVDPAAAAQSLKLQKQVNPAAYTLTPGTATTAPVFTPNLGQPNVRP